MSRRRAPLARAVRPLLVVIATATLLPHGSARAQDPAGGLGGFQGIAQADGLHAFYNPEGALPIAPPIDFGAPDAYATVASGPTTFARASAADPGDLLANPDALFSAGAPGYEPGTLPEYPYRATATSGVGEPESSSSPAPGLDASAKATAAGSTARATMPGTSAPAVATFGSMSSTATTTVEAAKVTVHARSVINDVNVLGVVKIGSIITDLTATSDGNETAVSGGTVVSDAHVLGRPVTITADGVREEPGATTTTNPLSVITGRVPGATKSANELLSAAGITVTVAGPVEQGGGRSGQLTAGGLRVDLEVSNQTFPALTALFDLIPSVDFPVPGAPSPNDLVELARARHLTALQLGRGMVTLTGRPAFAPGPLPALDVTPIDPGLGSAPAAVPGELAPPPEVAPAPPADATTAPVSDDGAEVPLGAGIGVLAVLGLLVQPFLGDRLSRAGTAVLASGPDSCAWEER